MYLQLLFEFDDSLLELLIFEHDFLCLLALVFKFAGKLVVLEHGQSGGGLELLLLEAQ